jgi:Photosynthesis affected mutant 68
MIRRMALFSGIPTAMGIGSFVVSYYVVINKIIELPTVAVLLVSLGFFGLGVLGLSYGILSTSWDEDRVGSPLGGEEFALNLGRMVQAWKTSRQEARSKS